MIVAITRASQTPHEITKKNLYDCMKRDDHISLDMMSVNYGIRPLLLKPTESEANAYRFIGEEPPVSVRVEFDFEQLKTHEFTLKLDVGASTYWSQTQAITTLDNLLMTKQILLSEYLERIPDDMIEKKGELIEAAKRREQMQGLAPAPNMPMVGGGEMPPVEGELNARATPPTEIPTGKGNGAMQRAIVQSGELPTNVAV